MADMLQVGQTLVTGAVRFEEEGVGRCARRRFYNTIYVQLMMKVRLSALQTRRILFLLANIFPFEGLAASIWAYSGC
jgi:hypothetical protein